MRSPSALESNEVNEIWYHLNQSNSPLLSSSPVVLPAEPLLCSDILMIAGCTVSERSHKTGGNKGSLRLMVALSSFLNQPCMVL